MGPSIAAIASPGPMDVEFTPLAAQGAAAAPTLGAIGVVVIGRNEGERLRRCLESVRSHAPCIVYVDSGSTDDSLTTGRTLADAVVELDMSKPFTAARARNAGFRRLMEIRSGLTYVFFVDGDCEVADGWLETARRYLHAHPDYAIVWGMRRERHPDKSIYNLLCDIEWLDYPLGETKFCGGDIVARIDAIKQVNGYRADLICGEEPEMCVRLRNIGWRIYHLDTPMTVHDAAMYRFGQWWTRTLRGGYGFALGAALHGAPPERHGITEIRRAWIWGLGIPAAAFALTPVISWWAILVLGAYPIQVIRLAQRGPKRSTGSRWLRAGALVLGKFPEMLGLVKFRLDQLTHAQSALIEYK